jgi:hypothetical protein
MDTIARGLAAEAKARATRRGNRIALLGSSLIAQGAAPRDPDASNAWTASTAVALNGYNKPTAYDLSNGFAPLKYKATTAGTTGATEPIWPQTVGGTVTDGTVVWTAEYLSGIPAWPTGYWTIAQQLSGQRLDEVYIVGASGKQSDVILSYLDRVLAVNPDIVAPLNLFENDIISNTLAVVITRWAAAAAKFDRVRALGIRLMLATVLPAGQYDSSGIFTSYSRGEDSKAFEWLNKQFRAYKRAHPEVILIDWTNAYIDPNPANPVWPENTATFLAGSGSGQALKGTDGIHPYVSRAYALAVLTAAALTENFPLVDRFGIANELNQRCPNPLLYGTAGTKGTNVGSGSVADSMSLIAASTSGTVTGVASKVARTDMAGFWQRLVYDATAGVAGLAQFQPTSNLVMAPLAVGDVVQAFGEIKLLANPTFLTAPMLNLRMIGGTPQWVYALNPSSSDQDIGQMITADTTFTLKTLPVPISPSTTSIQAYQWVSLRSTALATIDFGRNAVGKVTLADPS